MSRVILITGANRGLGREVAAQLAADGETVLLSARNGEAAAQAAAEIGGDTHPVQLDTSDPANIKAAAAQIEAEHGRLDVLVNNVGGVFDYAQKASIADLGVVQEALEINLFSAWRVTQAMVPLLRKASGARIVNVSSEAASLERMGAGTPAYGASKAALNALTRSLAAELAEDGVTVHAASPGWTATDLGGEGGRPVAEGAASIKHVVNLPAAAGTGAFYQDQQILPW
ncbi:SDR family NAD(P)-dependent oxidoreductase [[Kitasatospora] papulosa]|uniref:SDR family NAD(P)-dependent oxidoreductase n=1 Tax=Streptomyces TaxID=1883 RepID=UPI0004BE41F9|nr:MULTISPECIES: SDR family NAD(P)-dependent oxidoreductase [Streptomyces]MDX3186600.1 SDR family NAD(P)-dependent oxidoreductase [Streptomyces sp. ME02-7008A-1]MDX3307378.1 SDR family NAD(P)-dependent oxidoreductase [Streptomyces sp. ME02-7008A]WSZ45849.1 SDR family NAD(P)-dependent oxidoreductase [[Kitasatospora] papulosa]